MGYAATYHTAENVYQYIRSYYEENGIAPTVREIRDALGMSSTSVVAYNIRRLLDDGRLTKVHQRSAARNIIPTASL